MRGARLEAFSDGVFAVAITLLALNLAVAGPGLARCSASSPTTGHPFSRI